MKNRVIQTNADQHNYYVLDLVERVRPTATTVDVLVPVYEWLDGLIESKFPKHPRVKVNKYVLENNLWDAWKYAEFARSVALERPRAWVADQWDQWHPSYEYITALELAAIAPFRVAERLRAATQPWDHPFPGIYQKEWNGEAVAAVMEEISSCHC